MEQDPHVDATASTRLIAAYHQRYREAGRWKAAIWAGSAVLFASGLALAAIDVDAAALGLVASGYLLCSRIVLRPEMTRAHREGVVLQEQYDVAVFSLPWNRGLAGRPMSAVDVEELANRYRDGTDELSDWYVDGGKAPAGVRVLLGQLENAAWGARDHRRFSVAAGGAFVASVAATIAVGLARDVSLAVYVSAFAAPSLPWLLDLVDVTAVHVRASRRRGEIETELTDAWESLHDQPEPDVPIETLRAAQDRIFGVRRSSGRVPTWFYRLYRTRNQRAFDGAVRRMLASRGWLDGR